MPQSLPDITAQTIAEGTVRSADGTSIAFHRLGEGPPVILVHGSIARHTDWLPVARILAHSFSCFLVDRRGRSKSGHGESPYSMDRECEDIAAIAAVAGHSVSLIGHSYGGVCALEAALRMPVRRLVLYEPPLPVGGPIAGEYLKPYSEAICRGDSEAAIQLGLENFSCVPASGIARIRASRGWSRLCSLAPTWTRELEVVDSLLPNVDRYRNVQCPILLLEGSESPEHPLKDAARALATLPNVHLETLAGHDHVGMRTAPDIVASLIARFLAE